MDAITQLVTEAAILGFSATRLAARGAIIALHGFKKYVASIHSGAHCDGTMSVNGNSSTVQGIAMSSKSYGPGECSSGQ